MVDSVALDINNYSLNMNREYSVVQLTDYNESSSRNEMASNYDMPTASLTNVNQVHKISTTEEQLQDEEHEETKTTPVHITFLKENM